MRKKTSSNSRADRIKAAIDSSGCNQREIAEYVGVRPQSITKWLQSGNIASDNLALLAEVTGVNVQYLLFGETSEQERYVQNIELHDLVEQLSAKQAESMAEFLRQVKKKKTKRGRKPGSANKRGATSK